MKSTQRSDSKQLFRLKSLLAALFMALLSTAVFAASGDLDQTFGSGGIVITRRARASAMVIQSDGKIIVVGAGNSVFAVVRYNTDGSLDTSFGGTGIVQTSVGNLYSAARSVAIQPDGKIVVAGSANDSSRSSFAIVRYNPNGSLDTSFGGTGKVITSVGDTNDYATAVAIQSDGKIVAGGGESNYNIAIARYNSNGELDTTLNGTGKIIIPNASCTTDPPSMALQADGKIVVTGSCFSVFRFNSNGSPDTSFNGTGSTNIGVGDYGGSSYELAIQPDGKVVVVGYSIHEDDGGYGHLLFALVRLNPNGSLDTSFDGDGIVDVEASYYDTNAFSLAIQADGKIVAVSGFAIVRVSRNGSLDTTFNGTGIVTTHLPGLGYASAIAIQADGRIVVSGSTAGEVPTTWDFVVLRYLGGSNSRSRFDFDGDSRSDISVFRPSDRIWYLDQSTAGFSATQFGLSTDKITPADFDGDAKSDISIFRDGVWWRINSSNNTATAVPFGIAGDMPVPVDYTGDGQAELAVYRGGVWWSLNLATDEVQVTQFGISTDRPVPADYDGDGRVDQAVYRNGEWHLNGSSVGYTVAFFGLANDIPVPGDFDGDGKADLAVYRGGTWYVEQSTAGFLALQWGISTDIPVAADYDGDGRTDVAVYRNGTWYILQSSNGSVSYRQFGLSTDLPISGVYQ